MTIRTMFEPWRQQERAALLQAGIGRRRFMRSALAATALAAAPGGPLWADGAKPAAIPARLDATGLAGDVVSLSNAEVSELRAALRGSLLLSADQGYDTARRIWNPAFNRYPSLIARCANAQDVVHAVNFARTHRLLTAVRAGGHSLSGQSTCDGGLMIDLQPMKAVRVDAGQRRVDAECGVLLGELDRAAQAVGMATTLGTATDTGIAGLTLGGGLGRLMRRFGLSIDNLLEVDIVTADGQLRHANSQENPDLFWAIRGGGGNFGIVTRFVYQLHPLQHQVLSGFRIYPYSQARSVFEAVAELAERAPDELMLAAGVENVVTGDHPGRYATWSVEYVGEDLSKAEQLLAPLAALGKPIADMVKAVPYLAAQGAEGAANVIVPPNGTRAWVETGFLHAAPVALFDEIGRRFDAVPTHLQARAGFGQMGGAIARVKPEATAYWNRGAKFDFMTIVEWTNPAHDAAAGKAARDVWSGVEPFTQGYYINANPEAGQKRVRATFGGNHERLVALKRKYDAGNLFRRNPNINPEAQAVSPAAVDPRSLRRGNAWLRRQWRNPGPDA